ncbi:hypothetical protein [Rhizobium sp. SSA_523]|uniref:hypothetical protein n=1 Tax=Rhizobium sp. SSA_523 TaxID=2952477 RepID=UPI0020904870|nr:hypothetical protein [Rhizobium sp. SSA_523]MCO5732030.1 hypothetical protein [Rhizobium sp. SSA_523]WKC22632.1 hypothetical protein QTJ18_17370 [Rhizobium sp. SSA_523]
MLSEIAAWFITIAVLNPVQAEVNSRLEAMNASAQAVTQVQQCISTQGPRLINQAAEQPGWAVATAIGVTVGWTSPMSLLDTADPNCAAMAALLGENAQEGEGGDGEQSKGQAEQRGLEEA